VSSHAPDLVTGGQIKALWARVSQLAKVSELTRGQAEEAMRSIVFSVSDDSSTRSLTHRQAREVLDRLDEIIRTARQESRPTTRSGRAATEDSTSTASKQQGQALLLLARAIGWDRRQLHTFIRQRMESVCGGMPWPQTVGQARDIHEALEAILWRRSSNQLRPLQERTRTALDLPDLTAWERRFLEDFARRLNSRHAAGEIIGTRWKMAAKLAEIERKRGLALPAEDTP